MLELPRYFSYSFLARSMSKMLEKIADFFKTSVDYLIGRVDEPHSFFRGFSTNMLPDEILECCNGDTEKALEKWNQMYDLNSVIRLDMAQYNNIRNNIQFLSYKMGETPEELLIDKETRGREIRRKKPKQTVNDREKWRNRAVCKRKGMHLNRMSAGSGCQSLSALVCC